MRAKILILGLIFPLMVGSVLSGEKVNYNWQEFFPDPVEQMYIIMEDGKIFKLTTLEQRRISLNAWELKKCLKHTQYKIEDIETIIHNHRFKRKFSSGDWKFYGDLKRYGFNGLFLHYCHMTNGVYNIEGEEKSK